MKVYEINVDNHGNYTGVSEVSAENVDWELVCDSSLFVVQVNNSKELNILKSIYEDIFSKRWYLYRDKFQVKKDSGILEEEKALNDIFTHILKEFPNPQFYPCYINKDPIKDGFMDYYPGSAERLGWIVRLASGEFDKNHVEV